MAVFECKMCGGDLEIDQQNNIAICSCCGSKQTVANGDDEKKVKWINDANKRRIRNEFDQALRIYETVRNEFPDEAEAYWGICLCKYGIEYVDDPKTKRKIPTCHRSSFNSILQDEDYLNAVEKSDVIAKEQYQAEADEIDRINKRIQEIASKEKPYDVFICYKETDENGERTVDSVRAQQVYDELTKNDYKVFFARITLEDKLGEEYEPYIFSALNSAKIMLVFGTKDEYFKATWVRNEWSRFLNLMENDNSKRLYPCYADIDPYDLPVEFKHLQAQNMNKVGFEQDLVRNIEKVIPKKKAQPVYIQNGESLERLSENAEKLLNMHNFKAADEIYSKITLNYPDNYIGWWGKVLCATRNLTEMVEKDVLIEYINCLRQCANDNEKSFVNQKLEEYAANVLAPRYTDKKRYEYANALNLVNSLVTVEGEKKNQTTIRNNRTIEENNEAIDQLHKEITNFQVRKYSADVNLRNRKRLLIILPIILILDIIGITNLTGSNPAVGGVFLSIAFLVLIISAIIMGSANQKGLRYLGYVGNGRKRYAPGRELKAIIEEADREIESKGKKIKSLGDENEQLEGSISRIEREYSQKLSKYQSISTKITSVQNLPPQEHIEYWKSIACKDYEVPGYEDYKNDMFNNAEIALQNANEYSRGVNPDMGQQMQNPYSSYQQPAPSYQQPSYSYQQPAPSYRQSEPSYRQPEPSYRQPEPSYRQPEPSYQQPEPSYRQSESSYRQPEPSYRQPEPSYQQPEPSYQQPAYEEETQNEQYEQASEIRFCPACGGKADPDQMFCAWCGTKLI